MSTLTAITEKTLHTEDRWHKIYVLNDVTVNPAHIEPATRFIEKHAPDLLEMILGGTK